MLLVIFCDVSILLVTNTSTNTFIIVYFSFFASLRTIYYYNFSNKEIQSVVLVFSIQCDNEWCDLVRKENKSVFVCSLLYMGEETKR